MLEHYRRRSASAVHVPGGDQFDPASGCGEGPKLPRWKLSADPRTPRDLTLTTQCMTVFVVPGSAGVALPVPQWRPATDEDVRLNELTREIIRVRETIVPLAPSLTLEP